MKFQGYIDALPAGQPFEAEDEHAALAELDLHYDGMNCDGSHLTAHGETITVKEIPRLTVIELDGIPRTQAEACVLLKVPEGECLGCHLGDASPYVHTFGPECGFAHLPRSSD
jgi:hypothetical protein